MTLPEMVDVVTKIGGFMISLTMLSMVMATYLAAKRIAVKANEIHAEQAQLIKDAKVVLRPKPLASETEKP